MPLVFFLTIFFFTFHIQPLYSEGVPAQTPSLNDAFYLEVKKTSRYRVKGYNNLVEIQKLLDQGADVNAYHKDEATPLIAAIWNGDLPTIKFLLKNGADPNLVRKKGDNLQVPLSMVAVMQGLNPDDVAQMVRLLIHHGAKPNLQNDYGQTPLMVMVQYRQPKAVAVLLEMGADPMIRNNNDESALMLAAESGNIEILNLLLNIKTQTQTEMAEAVCFGVWKAQNEAVKVLAQKLDQLPSCALPQAVGMKNVAMIEDLLKLGADPNTVDPKWGAPLMLAAQTGVEPIVALLLKHNANPNIRNEDGWSALMRAAYEGHLQVVNTLLSFKANPNIHGKFFQTPLTLAAEQKHLECAKALIEFGVDFNEFPLGNALALHAAAENGMVELVTLMLEKGAPVDSRDRNDKTALMIACAQGNIEIVKILVEHQADLEAVNSRMMMNDIGDNFIGTPLMWAQKFGHQDIVDYLLSKGANPKPHIFYEQLPVSPAG